jgi:hypothetical protein
MSTLPSKTDPASTRAPSGVRLGLVRFAAIAAVEGLKLSAAGHARVNARESTVLRRAAIREAYRPNR